jgi:hypothetical protein
MRLISYTISCHLFLMDLALKHSKVRCVEGEISLNTGLMTPQRCHVHDRLVVPWLCEGNAYWGQGSDTSGVYERRSLLSCNENVDVTLQIVCCCQNDVLSRPYLVLPHGIGSLLALPQAVSVIVAQVAKRFALRHVVRYCAS